MLSPSRWICLAGVLVGMSTAACGGASIATACAKEGECNEQNCTHKAVVCAEFARAAQETCLADAIATRNAYASGSAQACADCVGAIDTLANCMSAIDSCTEFDLARWPGGTCVTETTAVFNLCNQAARNACWE